MSFEVVKKLVTVIVVLFLVISFWRDPAGSADSFGTFVGSVGGFFSSVIDKSGQFVKGLAS